MGIPSSPSRFWIALFPTLSRRSLPPWVAVADRLFIEPLQQSPAWQDWWYTNTPHLDLLGLLMGRGMGPGLNVHAGASVAAYVSLPRDDPRNPGAWKTFTEQERQRFLVDVAAGVADSIHACQHHLRMPPPPELPTAVSEHEALADHPRPAFTFEVLSHTADTMRARKNKKMTPHDDYGVHPTFRRFFTHELYDDASNEFAPFGNDEGADILAEWLVRRHELSSRSTVRQLLDDVTHGGASEFAQAALAGLDDDVDFAIIAIAFALLRLTGQIDAEGLGWTRQILQRHATEHRTFEHQQMLSDLNAFAAEHSGQ